ncbi:hypothetical protein [Azospirillum sp.]|uniref:hypothetical protein n=1 Tax=Azospirillum sp. TaxID=34012 RepID=UPI002D4F3CB9|nr:hypothetical protein [Azospirillum sp.]HYD70477.1 hypothetical protein [Azospirillum sp.]
MNIDTQTAAVAASQTRARQDFMVSALRQDAQRQAAVISELETSVKAAAPPSEGRGQTVDLLV